MVLPMRNSRASRLVALALAGLLGLVAAYAAAGVIGGLIPANPGWRPPAEGVTVWVEDNGVHTGLVLPKAAAGVDWRHQAPASHLRGPRYGAYRHIAVGWGDRDFYLDTPRWADVRPSAVIRAALGSDTTLLHVEHVPPPREGADARRIVLRPEEYRRLAAFVRASWQGGRRWPGYADHDAFYQARGRYSALATCNSWIGDALRAAGVRVGRWTPFPETVLWWFPVTFED
jgi:uncharacterized protein (TIGR02117 family)